METKKEFDNRRCPDGWMREFYERKCTEIDNGTIKNLDTPFWNDEKESDRKQVLLLLSNRISKFEINSIDDVLKFESLPRTMFSWGTSRNGLKPEIVMVYDSDIRGDGKKLIGIQTLSGRPCYYLLKVDSSFTFDNSDGELSDDTSDKVEHVLHIIESIYDSVDNIEHETDDGNGEWTEEDLEFPTLSCGCGYNWFEYELDFSDWSLYDY